MCCKKCGRLYKIDVDFEQDLKCCPYCESNEVWKMKCKWCGHTIIPLGRHHYTKEVNWVHANIGHNYKHGQNVPVCRIKKCNCLKAEPKSEVWKMGTDFICGCRSSCGSWYLCDKHEVEHILKIEILTIDTLEKNSEVKKWNVKNVSMNGNIAGC